MTFQIRGSVRYQGEERPIRCLPLDSFLRVSQRHLPDTAGLSSACWRGYVGAWETRAEALRLVRLDRGLRGNPLIPLSGLFPGCGESVEATWFSGQVTPDDGADPQQRATVGRRRRKSRPSHVRWFALLVHRGKLLREDSLDLRIRAVQARLTKHVDGLFPDPELGFLHSICAAPEDPLPKLIYADWLKERDDPRGQLLRHEAERQRSGGGPHLKGSAKTSDLACFPGFQEVLAEPIRPPSGRNHRQDIPNGYVDPEDRLWYWRSLAGIPGMTAEEREVQQLLESLGLTS